MINFLLLDTIKQSNYQLDSVNLDELLQFLLEHIGHQNSVNRDDLVYPVLAHLLHDDVLDSKVLRQVGLQFITEEFLFYDMENTQEYSVLTRSFTLLQLAILIYKHNQLSIFTDEEYEKITFAVLHYFELEQDYRGYNATVGWMHSIAHSADVFVQIFKGKQLSLDYYKRFLNELVRVFQTSSMQLIHNEEVRMIRAILVLFEGDIVPEEEWSLFFKKITDYPDTQEYLQTLHMTRNVTNLLQTLYFSLFGTKHGEVYCPKIMTVLQKK